MPENTSAASTTIPSRASNVRVALGILLILAAVNNMLVRVDLILNALISVMLAVGGYGVLKRKDWGPSVGYILSLATILFAAYEVAVFYYVYPGILQIPAEELLGVALRYLLPLVIICVATSSLSWKLRRGVKESVAERKEVK
jgi:hypothetical protein